jgi:hypothetical protein
MLYHIDFHDTHLGPTRFRGKLHQLILRQSSVVLLPKSVCQVSAGVSILSLLLSYGIYQRFTMS